MFGKINDMRQNRNIRLPSDNNIKKMIHCSFSINYVANSIVTFQYCINYVLTTSFKYSAFYIAVGN